MPALCWLKLCLVHCDGLDAVIFLVRVQFAPPLFHARTKTAATQCRKQLRVKRFRDDILENVANASTSKAKITLFSTQVALVNSSRIDEHPQGAGGDVNTHEMWYKFCHVKIVICYFKYTKKQFDVQIL